MGSSLSLAVIWLIRAICSGLGDGGSGFRSAGLAICTLTDPQETSILNDWAPGQVSIPLALINFRTEIGASTFVLLLLSHLFG